MSIKEYFKEISKLFSREFLFDRFDEITGRQLFTKKINLNENKEDFKHQYRGFTLYFKEIVESALAIFLVLSFLVLLFIFIREMYCNYNFDFSLKGLGVISEKVYYFSLYILRIAGGILILDSILLIAALISSPGIDETIDSISVTIAGLLLLILGDIDVKQYPNLILKVILPLSLIVVLLIFTKHLLRDYSSRKNNRENKTQTNKKLKINNSTS